MKVNIDPTAPSMDLTLKRFGAAFTTRHPAAMFACLHRDERNAVSHFMHIL